jgi:quinol-cytochrome oxidoreductase complex cytochrome b subunit
MFYYIPTPQEAGPSIQAITFLVPFGAIMRNMHFWAAQLLVIVATFHMLRVIFTGAYAPPRSFNYLLGLLLLILSLFLDFSGYILRWDEGVRWALVAGTNLVKSIPGIGPSLYILVMGGVQPNAATLIRFYTWHLFGLTLILVGLVAWHIFRVRRDGGIALPPPEIRRDQNRITRFELARREGLAALITLVVLLLLAIFIPAPLAASVTKVGSQLGDASAPWFFLWVQQLLKFGQAFWMGVIVPLAILLILASFPYILPNADPEELGEWFPHGNRLAQIITAILILSILILTVLAILP